MISRKMVTMLVAVIALCTFALVSTTTVMAAEKKKTVAAVAKAEPMAKIDINTASKDELMTLPGIGPAKADEIIKTRQKANFKNLDEIMDVSGIGEATFKKIKPFLKLS